MEKRLGTINQAAEETGLYKMAFYRAMEAGEITAPVQGGGEARYDLDELATFAKAYKASRQRVPNADRRGNRRNRERREYKDQQMFGNWRDMPRLDLVRKNGAPSEEDRWILNHPALPSMLNTILTLLGREGVIALDHFDEVAIGIPLDTPPDAVMDFEEDEI
jgi:hypothetical protein